MAEKPEATKSEFRSSSSPEEEIRVGVYTCYCGGNISDVVDCDRVAQVLGGEPNVIVSRTNMAMCSDAAQAMIQEDIKEHDINRVVVGACSPFLHEQTFRGAVSRAGLNPYLYHHVGLREQDSWAHHGQPEAATMKAVRLMRAGIAKARNLQPLEPIHLNAQQHALVIGGGVAGLRAAWDIARRGMEVTLVEKTPFLGGRMAQLETVFPIEKSARDSLHALIEKVIEHPRVTIYTNSEVVEAKGYVGDFQVKLRQISRGLDDGTEIIEQAIAACPIDIPDKFNYGLTQRKAIYLRYPGCIPSTAAIDWDNCTLCGDCAKVVGQGINLEKKETTISVNVGAIVLATGFQPYTPRKGEYGYGELPEVVTLPQFIRIMAMADGSDELVWNGHSVRDIAMIHCVGSRQVAGVHEPQPDGKVNDYCSRVCCTATLQAAQEVHTRFPHVNIFDVYEDIRTYGLEHEEYYLRASQNGVRFLRFHAEEGPVVMADPAASDHQLILNVKDHLTWGEELEVPADLVVLAVGMIPNPVEDLMEIFKVTPGSDRFLLEVHPKLRPIETAVTGIVLAGTAQSPMNIQECSAAAEAAAAKVAGLLSQGRVTLEPFVAHVNLDLCTGSGACVEVCAYEEAITLETITYQGKEVRRPVVSPANCVGCGSCVGACPSRAIDVQGFTLNQYEAMVTAIAADIPAMEVEA